MKSFRLLINLLGLNDESDVYCSQPCILLFSFNGAEGFNNYDLGVSDGRGSVADDLIAMWTLLSVKNYGVTTVAFFLCISTIAT